MKIVAEATVDRRSLRATGIFCEMLILALILLAGPMLAGCDPGHPNSPAIHSLTICSNTCPAGYICTEECRP